MCTCTHITGQSKLANIMFTYELARRLQPGTNNSLSANAKNTITANALHPGKLSLRVVCACLVCSCQQCECMYVCVRHVCADALSTFTVCPFHLSFPRTAGVVRTELSRYLISDPNSLASKVLTLLATPFTLSPEQVRLCLGVGAGGLVGRCGWLGEVF